MLYINKEKLKHMLKISTHEEVVDTIVKNANPKHFTVTRNDDEGWVLITPSVMPEGKVYPVLSAHTDTVGNTHPEYIAEDGHIWSNANPNKLLGADDRAGCYIIKELITRGHNEFIYMIFDWEEVGGIGSSNFVRTPEFTATIDHTSCYIGLDRMGMGQVATYGYDNDDFYELMTEMDGWKLEMGSFTDVANLADASGISCVNISVGYMNEHTRYETLDVSVLGVTLNHVAYGLPNDLWNAVFEGTDPYEGWYDMADDHITDDEGTEWVWDDELMEYKEYEPESSDYDWKRDGSFSVPDSNAGDKNLDDDMLTKGM